ncbi:hypothetical protein LVJ82_10640 [Vitreoscilla massiliensis]|uniref:Lipoprotein n=1 Tax=Vitreoscilla massiliensis TaxID=1689272 RepID=A0ABY4DXT1_9NEIS|nr:hypothetical protein [Vitreoscilla massiliensis]UOO87950.1 hypothetical protein LVJ82_10640 [Vitreoscilla massiliensis]
MMNKRAWTMATVVMLVAACQPDADKAAAPPAASTPLVSASAPVAPLSASQLAALPDSCQLLLANIEKCVVKYEKLQPADAQSYRLEYEQLKGQIVSGTDVQGLDAACKESNKQAEQMPESKC